MKIKIILSGVYTEEVPQFTVNVYSSLEDASKREAYPKNFDLFKKGSVHSVKLIEKASDNWFVVQLEDGSLWDMHKSVFKVIS